GKLAVRAGGLLFLLALLAAGFGVWAWSGGQNQKLYQEARKSYEAGEYAQAVSRFRELETTSPGYSDTRTLLALSYAQLAKAEAEKGQADQSRSHFGQAFELVSFPEVKEALVKFLVAWAGSEEKAGHLGEARVRLQEAAGLDPANQDAQLALARLKSQTELYWNVYELTNGPLGQQPLEGYQNLGAVTQQVNKLIPAGLQPYDTRL